MPQAQSMAGVAWPDDETLVGVLRVRGAQPGLRRTVPPPPRGRLPRRLPLDVALNNLSHGVCFLTANID